MSLRLHPPPKTQVLKAKGFFCAHGFCQKRPRNRAKGAARPASHRLLLLGFILLQWWAATPPCQASPVQTDATKLIIVGGDHNYPPYEFLDEDGQPAGYNVELTQAIAEVMGLKIKVKLGSWDEMRQALERGEVDALQGMIFSPERNKIFDFTPPHTIVHQSIFARKSASKIKDLKELAGKELVVQRGGFMHDYLLQNHVEAKLILVDTHAEALRLLASGKYDYALSGNLPGLFLGKKLGLSNIKPVGKPFAGQNYCYAVKKGNKELLTLFSEGLAILKNTGRHQQIYDKWLSSVEPRGIAWKKIVRYGSFILIPLLLILILTVVWSRTLQLQVAIRTKALEKEVLERKKATEELQLRQEQLIQADKMTSLGTLVSGVAHEINNPTGLLLLNLPSLEKIYRVSEAALEERFKNDGDFSIGGLKYSLLRSEAPRLFGEMQDSAQRIKRIVDDLKGFSRQGDADTSQLVELNQVIEATVRLAENSIKKATNHFFVNLADELPPFRGDGQRIEQVLVNLLLNACQALPGPEKSITIHSFFDSQTSRVGVEIRDQGIGIPTENLSRLTDPFFTTKRETGGTGLGLSVSAGIVKAHRGELKFHSAPGQGTKVTLLLPTHSPEEQR